MKFPGGQRVNLEPHDILITAFDVPDGVVPNPRVRSGKSQSGQKLRPPWAGLHWKAWDAASRQGKK